MERAGVDGYIINVNSILTYYLHNLPRNIPQSLYMPSKFALAALTEGLRKELLNNESRIKVSVSNSKLYTEFINRKKWDFFQSISLGLVDTESLKKLENDAIAEMPKLQTEDVANAILYLLGTPAHVQVKHFMQ